MSDIVKRLKDLAAVDNCQASLEAAAEIERLRQVLENVQEARFLQGKAIVDGINEIELLRAEGDKARARGDKLRMALEDIAYPNPLHNEDNLMGIARAALEGK